MKYPFIAVPIFTAFCCSNPGKKTGQFADSTMSAGQYPKEVTAAGLDAFYDNTKWLLYCIHSTDTCKFDKRFNMPDTITFGMLPLRLDTLINYNDTTEINLSFYFQDSIKCDSRSVRNTNLTWGAAYKAKTDTVLYYTSQTTANRFWERGKHSRFQQPLQPEVISYIKTNWNKLHPWFRNEAVKRGVNDKH